MIIFHIHDEDARPPSRRRLDRDWTAVALPFDQLDGAVASAMSACLFDVDLTDLPKALRIRRFLGEAVLPAIRVFACRRGDRHAAIQAWALSATDLVDRPSSDAELVSLLELVEARPRDDRPTSTVTAAIALEGAFRGLETGSELGTQVFASAARDIDHDIREVGLEVWLQSIRAHHAGTYQHCLLVTGVATSLGLELGFSAADRTHLTIAALLHDIGKARIDPNLLDKPSQLTAEERALFQMHTVWGHDYLARHSDLPAPILDVVRHHHEYLDGSGYPDGLRGAEISDLTRLVTISDVFAALIERRAYKPPMPPEAAHAVLRDMANAGRLEMPLVEAFRSVADRCPDWGDVDAATAGRPLRVA